jgi:CspA family cold shock protein
MTPEMISSEVLNEAIPEREYGTEIGCCRWFNKRLGYGFITVYSGPNKGVNIFTHHTGIQPLNSNFKTLKKGEYVSFDVIDGKNGTQAVGVKGILGGPLMCDNVETLNRYTKADLQPQE